MWEKDKNRENRTFSTATDLGPSGRNIMPLYRFKQILSAFEVAFNDESGNDWAMIGNLIDGFNKNRSENIAASNYKVLDESMSAFVPRT